MEQLGKYELVKRLAVGGMAELYLARSSGPKGFRRTLVLKKLLPHLSRDPSFVEMFLGEARIAGTLDHPNIVQVHEVGEAEGAFFIAMEYVDGPNLRTLAERASLLGQPLSPYLAAKIVSFVCDGLGYAHERRDPETGRPLRVVHRDVSPENVIVARNGAVKVVDFGVAKAATQTHRTQTGVVKGKLGYMAPEQMARQPIDHRADVYSLGVVLYELLSGARPHEAADDVALVQAVLRGERPVPLAERRPDLPPDLVAIVDRALEREPEARYQSCRVLQADLERFIHRADAPIGPQDLARLVADLQAEPSWGKVSATPAESSPEARPSAGMSTTVARHPAGPASRAPERPERPAPAVSREPRPGSRAALASGATLALLAVGIGVLAYSWTRGGDGEVVAAGAPPAAPAEERSPAGQAPAPQPSEEAAPAGSARRATVTVQSRPPAAVRIGARQGPSPFTAQVEPGEVEIEVSDAERGFSKVERVKVGPGEHLTREVRFSRTEVVFRSVPEARVFVNGRQVRGSGPEADVTPIKVLLYEGKHQVRFQCLSGKEDNREVTVPPFSSKRLEIDGRCARR